MSVANFLGTTEGSFTCPYCGSKENPVVTKTPSNGVACLSCLLLIVFFPLAILLLWLTIKDRVACVSCRRFIRGEDPVRWKEKALT